MPLKKNIKEGIYAFFDYDSKKKQRNLQAGRLSFLFRTWCGTGLRLAERSFSCSGTDLSFAERSVFVPEQVHGPLKVRFLFRNRKKVPDRSPDFL
ncbi:CLUMA_CG000102, isoform A [Clunio marinus]|uniref:CLUMA_CG000102, isoform A n=1 Tax=Clunio marinus TaxID=568069 RepID=A0A1J1HEY9_9DIPT|nr:CLUMA_CG000102, isoform A [Clunio marinus]